MKGGARLTAPAASAAPTTVRRLIDGGLIFSVILYPPIRINVLCGNRRPQTDLTLHRQNQIPRVGAARPSCTATKRPARVILAVGLLPSLAFWLTSPSAEDRRQRWLNVVRFGLFQKPVIWRAQVSQGTYCQIKRPHLGRQGLNYIRHPSLGPDQRVSLHRWRWQSRRFKCCR